MKQKLMIVVVACFSLSMHASGRAARFFRERGEATQGYQLRTAEQRRQSFDEKFGKQPWFKDLENFRSPLLVVFTDNGFKRGVYSHRVGNAVRLKNLGELINNCLGN